MKDFIKRIYNSSSEVKFVSVILAIMIAMALSIVILLNLNVKKELKITQLEFQIQRDSMERYFWEHTPQYGETLYLSKDNFFKACQIYGIHHPDVVYCQALLESANFKSNVYKRNNNFLGLYDSINKQYYNFSHWSYCLGAYSKKIQNKYNKYDYDYTYEQLPEHERYFHFLEDIHYAEDPGYIEKLRRIHNSNFP